MSAAETLQAIQEQAYEVGAARALKEAAVALVAASMDAYWDAKDALEQAKTKVAEAESTLRTLQERLIREVGE